MTNLENFVTEIASYYGVETDFVWTSILKENILGYRATILKQEYDKNGKFPVGSEYSICLPLTTASPIECCLSSDVELEVRKTKNKVPSSVRGNFKPEPYNYVGTTNSEKELTYIKPEALQDILLGTKFAKYLGYYTHYNDYLFTFGYEGGSINVRTVFSNPLQLLELQDCQGKNCLEEIHIEDDMKRTIKIMIMEEFARIRNKVETAEVEINSSKQ